ncbi:MAG: hypothetical protein IID16_00705 [Candidatus Marinimicrobia bacterium]|nr:hypothetical protein [Candidatus Neomarinimicrobiota bacterium]
MTNKRWIHVLDSDYLGRVKLEDDPDGWDSQRINIARSKIFFGLFRTQTSVLRFKGDGREYVRNVYEVKGTEHVINIGIYEYNDTTKRYELYYPGIIDLSTYSNDEDLFVDVDVNDSSFSRKVRSRDDVKVNLSRIKSIDGITLPENNKVTVNLHQRELLSTGEFLLNEATSTVESESGLDEGNNWEGFTLPISLQSSNSEIDNLSSQTVIALYAVGGAFWDPAGEESIVLFTGTVKGTLSKVNTGSTQPINVSFLLRVYDDNTLTTVDFDSPISNATFEIPDGQTDVTFTFTINKQFGGVPPAVNIGANAVISLIAQNTNVLGSGNDAFICEFTQIDFTVAQNLQFKDGGPAQGYLMHEAFERVVQVITDKEDSFKSDYLGRIDIDYEVNGAGAFETLHSALQIRRIPGTDPSLTLKDLFTSLNAQNNLGLGIEFNEVGQPFLRLEEKGHFFSGEVILTVHSVSEFGKDFSRDWAYSSIKVGYEKSATEELNGLEEYNNKFNFDTIIGTFKNELDLVSKIRWDGYGIEKMRRLSFDTNPNEDTKEDNDIFGVVVLEDGVDQSGKKKYKSAKDEAYDIVENIFSPGTAYNLDKTPGRMLRANGGVIRPGLEKYLDDEITLGFAEQKENLKSRKTGESAITENEPIDVKTLDTGFWIPEIYKFKSALTRERFKIIQRKSNGIIKFSTTTKENTTKYNYGWILDINSESDDELADWTLLRVNTSSPQVTLIDPEGDDPDIIIPPIDPSPLFGAFEGAFPFVFVNGDETFNRLLEDGSNRLTEDGNNRILEDG